MSAPARMALKSTTLVVLLLCGALALHLLTYSTTALRTDDDHRRLFNDNYKIFSLTLPENIDFCGEAVPLHLLDVRERLDRELLVNTYWQSNSLLAHKRATRWFPIIEPILKKHGIPNDFKFIPLIESNLTNAVSPKILSLSRLEDCRSCRNTGINSFIFEIRSSPRVSE